MRSTLVISLAAALIAAGCVEEQHYVTPPGGGTWAFAITEDTPPFFTSEEGDVFLVEQRIDIPYRLPTADELAALSDIGDAQIPYAQLPWLRRGDIQIQIDWTVSNISTEDDADFGITINGYNEFHEYNPGIQVVDEDLVVDFSQWERTIHLEPGARISGTVRQEQMDEVAVDLATVVNGVANANQIVHPQNISAVDPRAQEFIPDVIPGLMGVRAGLRVQGEEGSAPPLLVIELTVRVFDIRGVLPDGDMDLTTCRPAGTCWTPPTPVLFGPADIPPPTP